MSREQEIIEARQQKLEILEAAGQPGFNHRIRITHNLSEVAEQFTELESTAVTITVGGRIMTKRGQGAIIFVTLKQNGSELQAVFKQDVMDGAAFNLFKETVDLGDIIFVTGTAFRTKRGQPSILTNTWNMATKALLPMPDKHAGIQDEELELRKRYLNILIDDEVRRRFILRSQVIQAIRGYFFTKNFVEVETPILQNQAGGAMAKVFETHHLDYDMPMVLRIALELEHKMTIAGGIDRLFEIGKIFRNEGTDPTHLQEFTMLEWYAAYVSLEENINWTEEMLKDIAKNIVNKTIFTVYDKHGNGVEVDFMKPWPRKKFGDLLREKTGIEMHTISDEEIKAIALKNGLNPKEAEFKGRANLLDFVYKKTCRNEITDPVFVTHYPADLKPLAQPVGDGTAFATQLVVGGAEITNMYQELVDPRIQRKLLEDQARTKQGGDDEAMDIDERFLTAMAHGMPPMTGFGMGIDRLMAIFTNQKNIRDTILFPIVRPE